MAQYKEVYKDMQKKAKQIKIAFLFTKFSVFASAIHYVSLDHHDVFQPETLILFQ